MLKRTEVIQIMAHLVLSLAVLLSYLGVLIVTGEDNETLKSLSILAFGFWFGARQSVKDAFKAKRDTDKKEE